MVIQSLLQSFLQGTECQNFFQLLPAVRETCRETWMEKNYITAIQKCDLFRKCHMQQWLAPSCQMYTRSLWFMCAHYTSCSEESSSLEDYESLHVSCLIHYRIFFFFVICISDKGWACLKCLVYIYIYSVRDWFSFSLNSLYYEIYLF